MQGDEEEKLLALTCLVDDLHEIKGHVNQLWSRYKDRELDLVTTSLGTNAAIEWAREIQLEYSEVLGDASDIAHLQGLLWARHCIAQGHNPARSLDDGKIPDSIYDLSTHFFWSVRMLLEAYLDLRVAGTLPSFKQNYYGNRDVFLTSPSSIKGHQKFHLDKVLLTEILPHFEAVTRMDGLHPYQDAIVEGLCTMFQEGRVSLWLSFSVQLFLEIQYELGPQVDQGFSELIGNAITLERSLEATLSSQKAQPSSQWPASGIIAIEKLAAELQTLQSKDLIRQIVSVGMSESPEGIVFGTADHQLLKVHPLTCGLWLYTLRARYHDLGVRLANAQETIVSCAHIYHALRREGILHETWPDMEMLLDIHDLEQVFAGPVPQKPIQYVTQYRATLDRMFPEQDVRSPRGYGDQPTRDDRPLRFGATATRLFMNQYVTRDPGCTPLAIHEALRFSRREKDWGHSIPESECCSLFARRLNDFCGMIRREAIEFYFDYFQFRQFCWLVLFSIKRTVQAIQERAGVKAGSQTDGQNLSAITALFKYLINSCNVVRKGLKLNESEKPDLPSKVVLAVGARLDAMLSHTVDSRACRSSEVVAERVSRVCHTNLLQQVRDLYRASGTSRSDVKQD
ncbi:hypothetical protein LTR41_011365 [Exophiala xenobiotica]|nr:hypothetical protein LTR41_011365 [Exophiala xenobiotica]KAK5550772.1 hypothetical protein LTR46_011228 [Exophiala xenobiotica]